MSTVTETYRSLSFLVRLHGDNLLCVMATGVALALAGEIGLLLMQAY